MRVTVTAFTTLDGVFQAPGGPHEDPTGGFDKGGWMAPYVDDAMVATMGSIFSQADAFLLGRRTYDIFAGSWPKVTDPDDPIAGRLNTLPKYVASRTLTEVTWAGSRLLRGDVATAVSGLQQTPGRELQVHGSGMLLQTLLHHDLVEEYRLLTVPIVLGAGKRLFEGGTPPRRLALVDRRTTDSGVDVAVYRPDGMPAVGAIGPSTVRRSPVRSSRGQSGR